MSVEKYGWTIQKGLFALSNQDSTFSHSCENRKIFKITSEYFSFLGVIHIMASTLREWRVRQKWDIIGRRGARGGELSGRPIFISFIKENWICAMTRHHANNILLARNLPFDSDVTFFFVWFRLFTMYGVVFVP